MYESHDDIESILFRHILTAFPRSYGSHNAWIDKLGVSLPEALWGLQAMTERAVILVSGGLDSATVLKVARSEGFECHALSFDYGQRHRVELDAARAVARTIGVVSHVVLEID